MIADRLRSNLMALATTYADATGAALSAVSKRFYGHTSFFEHFRTGDMSVSIDKYDAIVAKMRREWPPGAPWPRLHRIWIRAPRMRRRNGSKK